MVEQHLCELCGEPMPPGQEAYRYHVRCSVNYAGPKPPLKRDTQPEKEVNQETRHPAIDQLMRFFQYTHLPPQLQDVSKPFCDLARNIADGPQNAETTAGLRKLLEAKDCIVRANLLPAGGGQ